MVYFQLTVCNGTYTSLSGTVQSVNYPSNYLDGMTCFILLSLPAGYTIELALVDFNTEIDYDYVTVSINRKDSDGIWLSGKTFDCRPRDCEFDPPPSLQLKLLIKGDMYWFCPGIMLPCISALHWAR